ncbi:MAG TPA: valine--tRNA ligase, partial [Porticoccaceae bacterium]|nr:valine--tRNA ligase [Porticoccaceae bacterium]
QAIADIEWVKGVIVGVRNIRGEMNIPPAKALPVLLNNASQKDQQYLESNRTYLGRLANLESISLCQPGEDPPPSATALVGDMEVLVPMAGVIDKTEELARLDREIGKLNKEVQRLNGKLGNEKFVAKAPETVVEAERQKLAEAQSALQKLEAQKSQIEAL